MMLLSSLSGISIWYFQRLADSPCTNGDAQTAVTFSFYTILSNAIIVVMAAALLLGRGRLYTWFSSPSVQAACCLYIAFVGLGFWFLLGGPGQMETLLDWMPQMTAHTLSPILGFVFWLRAVPVGHIGRRDPFLWLIYPSPIWCTGSSVGRWSATIPTYFIDVNALGYGGVALWSGALVVVFLVLGSLMLLVDQRRAARLLRTTAAV